jgi:hypothetical protein
VAFHDRDGVRDVVGVDELCSADRDAVDVRQVGEREVTVGGGDRASPVQIGVAGVVVPSAVTVLTPVVGI